MAELMYTVTQKGVTLNGKLQEVGAVVELTERQATVSFVNKVEPYVEPEKEETSSEPEGDEPDGSDENPPTEDDAVGEGEETGVKFTPEELAELERLKEEE